MSLCKRLHVNPPCRVCSRALRLACIILVLSVAAQIATISAHIERWVLEIPGGAAYADQVAQEYGIKNLGEVPGFTDIYLFEREENDEDGPHKSNNQEDTGRVHRIKRHLESHPEVVWADHQAPAARVKRDVISVRASQASPLLNFQPPLPANSGQLGSHAPKSHSLTLTAHNRASVEFDDELWTHQWYMHDGSSIAQPKQSDIDLKVRDVWKMGYTGQGIVVSILDDGLEWNHTDILPNYDPWASWDFNNNRSDPFPRYDSQELMNHGTRCAGEVAMAANNRKCGVGVAYNAKIGGIKCLEVLETPDNVEASSLNYNLDHIDIYCNSWGPKDNGQALGGPRRLATQALERGARYGRQGKGALYIWANGNGGPMDHCNCDGYVGSIYTIAIGGVTQQGQLPYFGERCASTMAVTASSGAYTDRKIVTTDLHNKCTTDYAGTSASAPLAAGIYALLLEANRNLTWRDVQHITVWNSNSVPIRDNPGWRRNAAGLLFNSRFGFGLLNAKAMVEAALKWQQVPKKSICIVSPVTRLPIFMQSRSLAQVFFITDGCQSEYDRAIHTATVAASHSTGHQSPTPVIYLEHVELIVDIEYASRGDLDIFLVSPAGTVSTLLARRPLDSDRDFNKWHLMSLHFWAETTPGKWTAIVRDKFGQNNRGLVRNLTLVLHGTTSMPAHMVKPTLPAQVSDQGFIESQSEFEEDDAYNTMFQVERSQRSSSSFKWMLDRLI